MKASASGWVERNSAASRRLHTLVYVLTVVLLGTGWWLLSGREGSPSPLSRALGAPDIVIHVQAGWVLIGVAWIVLLLRFRSVLWFVRESFHFDRKDARWLASWPRAALTGRFSKHRGHFDPGQRLANLGLAVTLLAIVGSGVGLVVVHGGGVFVWLLEVHKWATYALTLGVLGHVLLASGLLPGYRGVWRAMHLRGQVREATARRLWPAWAEVHMGAAAGSHATARDRHTVDPVRSSEPTYHAPE